MLDDESFRPYVQTPDSAFTIPIRSKHPGMVALQGRRRWPRRVLPDGEVSSYTSDLVSAVRNAARGLDAPFYVSGLVRLQQPVYLSWVDPSSVDLARLPGKFPLTRNSTGQRALLYSIGR